MYSLVSGGVSSRLLKFKTFHSLIIVFDVFDNKYNSDIFVLLHSFFIYEYFAITVNILATAGKDLTPLIDKPMEQVTSNAYSTQSPVFRQINSSISRMTKSSLPNGIGLWSKSDMDDEETVEPQAKPKHWEKIFETCGPSQNDKPELREIAELIEEFEQNIAHNATLGC
ncbi:hypothetical protein FPQ18DRAFT_308754 [Pyronema domesticum]|nr:hypothetical protein FPQ18DRAFT_308754 [Pyronema domesticum]